MTAPAEQPAAAPARGGSPMVLILAAALIVIGRLALSGPWLIDHVVVPAAAFVVGAWMWLHQAVVDVVSALVP